MTKNQKIGLGVILFVLFGGSLFAAWYKHRPQIALPKTPDGKPVTNGGAGFSDQLNPALTLKEGDAGLNVKALQNFMNTLITKYRLNISTLVPDGIFGTHTEDALQAISNKLYKAISLNDLKTFVAANLTPPPGTSIFF